MTVNGLRVPEELYNNLTLSVRPRPLTRLIAQRIVETRHLLLNHKGRYRRKPLKRISQDSRALLHSPDPLCELRPLEKAICSMSKAFQTCSIILCRGGPPWPPHPPEITTWGDHGGPPLQSLRWT